MSVIRQSDGLWSKVLPLTVNKSTILCSALFSFRWREPGLCSRFLNWSKAETHPGDVSISFFFFFSLITQFANDPHEWARRILGDLTMHGPQYADRTCWVHFFIIFFSLFFLLCYIKCEWTINWLVPLYLNWRDRWWWGWSKTGGGRRMAVICWWWWSRA